jgi:hypothetical protein
VDEEEVDGVDAERGERAVERPARVVGTVVAVVELAGDVDVVAVEAGGADRLPDLPLVAVHLGGVYVPVADLERTGDGLDRLGGIDLEYPEAELGDRGAVVELDGGQWTGHVTRMGVASTVRCSPASTRRRSRSSASQTSAKPV